MRNPNQNKGLKPFTKGYDPRRCTKGKQKVPIDEALDQVDPIELVKTINKYAKKGNMKAAEMLLERIYGKVNQPMDLTITEQPIFDMNKKEKDVSTDDGTS